METLIEDLKKVMNSEIEDKDKYMQMLINGFLRERNTEQLKLCEVSQQRELFFCDYCKEDNPHKIYEFKKMKECKGCGLITKI